MKTIILFIAVMTIAINGIAQNVGIGTTTPHVSAALEVKATGKGILIPRTSTITRTAIAAPAKGLLVYDTTSSSFWFHNGSAWVQIGASNGWLLSGNGGTNPATHFIGTTDAQPLVFKVNNTQSGYLDYDFTKGNTSFGYQGLLSNSSGVKNTAIGYLSLFSNTTGYQNTATGDSALYANTTGSNNSGFGAFSLYRNTTGQGNTSIGYSTLINNTSGNLNTTVGNGSLYNNQTGSYNTATGVNALYSNTMGTNNTANGYNALYNNTIGTGNTAMGVDALFSNTSTQNTAIGYSAMSNNTNGSSNTALGYLALNQIRTGDYNTAIGVYADVNDGGNSIYSHSSAFGYLAMITASNQVRIGSIVDPDHDPTSIGGKVGWSTLSDGRVKTNIKENVPGLAFITKLKPITYTIDNDAVNKIIQRPVIKDKNGNEVKPLVDERSAGKTNTAIVYTGFIAQEVEKAAKSLNFDFSGVDAAKNDKDLYGLRYGEFVIPLVKAVQEQQAQIETLKKENEEQKKIIEDLLRRLNKLEAQSPKN